MSSDNQLNIRVDADLKRAFIEHAKAEGTTATELIVGFMKQYLGIQSDRPTAINTAAIEADLLERLNTRVTEMLDKNLDKKLESVLQGLYERLERAEVALGEIAA